MEEMKTENIEILQEIITEAQAAIRNIRDDAMDDVQQDFIKLESLVQDLQL